MKVRVLAGSRRTGVGARLRAAAQCGGSNTPAKSYRLLVAQSLLYHPTLLSPSPHSTSLGYPILTLEAGNTLGTSVGASVHV
ncbi:hypothetical protein EVAR_21215_1 [Eumeta japonica]|uniref:Uncharacterized protein n=1 Tax=Eumeta variegata TaxID=151549 RepID=A0A4C1UQH7_EUMVA|nr:hypothetical protein EVAR_21215_1 [Eumeta japonica]